MFKKIILVFLMLFFSGCFVNERGVSNRFYDDCKEYYDASGIYHKECPQNWIDLPLTPETFEGSI
ncbi:hypothetical protein CINS5915_02915 [Campylobacter insulaenigrae]|uniref:Lipoprotein n=1 Tax=Campylobacter insulaenigrae TaxID=260714 RepID=A0ABY3G6F6_9BACT|nr:hypothetical protein [Campylobacter insulaenigrae]MCR6570832.1 hypothetical protein [Campylobacter insulaenigrae]MCR6572510.1 hypothetical protein [Campylobacter insulaenigrae]MCR6573478.1 hypothetical protein [Campylobacter insulaenigrae]MCR6575319.1 hypothetical protein [Campylobacter insulaenigrae]MCR6576881.1 hypothetical protein [Campylobacter insulaenigrae]